MPLRFRSGCLHSGSPNARQECVPQSPLPLFRASYRGTGRIDEKADRCRRGHDFVQQLKTLCDQRLGEEAHACDVAARTVEACNEAKLDGVAADCKYDRNRRGRRLCGHAEASPPCNNHGDPATHQVRGHRRQAIVLRFRPAIQNFDVPPLDIALFSEALLEIAGEWPICGFPFRRLDSPIIGSAARCACAASAMRSATPPRRPQAYDIAPSDRFGHLPTPLIDLLSIIVTYPAITG